MVVARDQVGATRCNVEQQHNGQTAEQSRSPTLQGIHYCRFGAGNERGGRVIGCCTVAAETKSGCADDFCREGWAGDWVLHGGGRGQERLRRRFLKKQRRGRSGPAADLSQGRRVQQAERGVCVIVCVLSALMITVPLR